MSFCFCAHKRRHKSIQACESLVQIDQNLCLRLSVSENLAGVTTNMIAFANRAAKRLFLAHDQLPIIAPPLRIAVSASTMVRPPSSILEILSVFRAQMRRPILYREPVQLVQRHCWFTDGVQLGFPIFTRCYLRPGSQCIRSRQYIPATLMLSSFGRRKQVTGTDFSWSQVSV